jgi:hypothetical protein
LHHPKSQEGLHGANNISFSHENCEQIISFTPSKTRTWQRQKKALHHPKQDPGNGKNSFYIKGVSIKYLNPD